LRFTYCFGCGFSLKKTPALTLPHRTLTITHALELVRYYTWRNDDAYRSHRKKLLASIADV